MWFLIFIVIVLGFLILKSLNKQSTNSEKNLMLNVEYRSRVFDEVLNEVYADSLVNYGIKHMEELKRIKAQFDHPGSTFQHWKKDLSFSCTRSELKNNIKKDFSASMVNTKMGDEQ